MTVRVVPRAALDAWVNDLVQRQKVYGVQLKEERFAFGPLVRAADLRLDYDVTLLPPKKYFLPQREVLSRFDRFKVEFEPVLADEPFVLLGVHPYDFEAIRQLDAIFSRNHPDAHYLTRRRNATIVVSDVETPSQDVFAACMGTATADCMDGWDVLLTRIADATYAVEARTEKGTALVGQIQGTKGAGEADLEQRRAVWDRNRDVLKKHQLRMNPEDLPDLLARSYDHPVWEEKAALCYSCGSCNLVCPTCYCFDVADELHWDLQTGERTRHWDGCMLEKFAEVAGGHNFRGGKAARYRHRYYRKGKWIHDLTGDIACVGCGRCISACTAKIANPVEVFNRLMEATS
ncbi:MAG: 4Fe-4S dicluster domain-containing protein [Planctomycetes bacterium]|nr:4Fe-4S dicluster domain-containing protein [Planctomycetota bacterium]